MIRRKPLKKISTSARASIIRVSSGISGLDKLIEGGFVKGSTILITGGTGTGKTTFCAQFILDGLKKGEPGVYITLEEDPEDIKLDFKRFGFNFEKFEKNKTFNFVYQNPFEVSDISSTIMNAINSVNAKRVVIDPISLMGMYMKDPAVLRKRLFEIVRLLKKTGVTTLITSEIKEDEKGLSRFGVGEFIADGVIVLQYLNIGKESFGNLQIRKLRRTKHEHGWFPINIGGSGIEVSEEEVSTILK
ncbi:MAG: AAA family ATPase [Candidatus Aenigmarchaeota archaeon]|nr:AAA family ATPase [Candidatus Aenigmarchaeota archaeon]NIP40186.1 AAA family ATPase [Candidatus Aenigmarchaeota archaeon]NIQ17223.1 AAA family ATPase [Candidatus Aenigmarchaeota archaeon]NIS73013.1 AAA family ATPase [Candidatus Aenigmarchaeota archaeon]